MNDIKKGKRNEMNQLYGLSCYMRGEKKKQFGWLSKCRVFLFIEQGGFDSGITDIPMVSGLY